MRFSLRAGRDMSTRRDFLRMAGAGALAAAAPGLLRAQQAQATRPNVLFIAVDDLNDWANCLGGYGGSVHTPNLDRLAARGVLFTNAHCAAPSCNPSRTAVMTGIRPDVSGVYNNNQNWHESPVLQDAETIPRRRLPRGRRWQDLPRALLDPDIVRPRPQRLRRLGRVLPVQGALDAGDLLARGCHGERPAHVAMGPGGHRARGTAASLLLRLGGDPRP